MKRITKPRTLVPLLVLLLIVSCEKYPDTKLPNIVLIIGDDHGYPYFGFMGADYVKTPNMDALALSGVLFKNGYVPDNHCRPSLATLVTGMLPVDYNNDVNQLILKEEIVDANLKIELSHNAMRHFSTLPKILKKKGYKSYQGGKWWEFHYENGGFDEGMTTGWTKEERKSEGWFRKFMGGYGLELARATMKPVYDFIDKNLENPFFLWYAPELPHYPFDAPEKYYDIYEDKDMTESAKRYYANCTWFDDGVGELLNYLKKVGEYENTLFIYVNDNGWEQTPDQEFWNDPMRSHNGGDKGKLSLFDQSFRTPIIFSWDGMIKKDVQLNHLIHSSDIPATILDYLEIEIPKNFYGKSYKNAIDGNDFSGREEIVGNITTTRSFDDMMGKPTEGYWIRDEDWFLSWNITEKEINLYDIKIDQNNYNNRADQKPEIVKTMIEKIETWKDERKREF
jgi:arylsulfatase A-like enzyme